MFGSRRSTAPPAESAKVAEVVQAYYDAGRRPASHLKTPPELSDVVVADGATPDEAPFSAPEPGFTPEPEPFREPEPAPVVVAEAAHAGPARHSTPVHKTLSELAEELEAFIEVIRYGDDLGSRTARV
jgi:hypothetical protein